jgi:hypothetical protein
MLSTNVTAEEGAVLDILMRTGPCGLDDLVTYLPHLSWDEVFLAVDRMSRDGRLLLRQIGYSTYQITVPSQFAFPRPPARQEAAHP